MSLVPIAKPLKDATRFVQVITADPPQLKSWVFAPLPKVSFPQEVWIDERSGASGEQSSLPTLTRFDTPTPAWQPGFNHIPIDQIILLLEVRPRFPEHAFFIFTGQQALHFGPFRVSRLRRLRGLEGYQPAPQLHHFHEGFDGPLESLFYILRPFGDVRRLLAEQQVIVRFELVNALT